MAERAACRSSCVNVHSQQHVLVMCATAFYLIENYPLDVGPDFSASIIQVSGPGRRPHGGTGAESGALTWTSLSRSDVWGDAVWK